MRREGLRFNIIIFLIFTALALICYSNALHSPFLLDDDFLITYNPYVQDLGLAPKLLGVDIFHFKNQDLSEGNLYYRPLQMLSYSLDYLFFKLNTFGYHLGNVLLHGLNCFILFLLLGLVFKNRLLAFLTSVIFCIHPIQVSVVAYITGRGSLLEAFFVLLSLFFAVQYFLRGKKADYAFSLLLFILALFTREGAVLLPLFVVLCAYFIPTDRKKIFIRVLPFFLIAAAYISFRLFFLPCSKCSVLNLFSPGRIRDFILLSQDYLGQLILPAGLRGLFFGNTLFTKLSFITLAWLSSFVILVGIIIFRKKKLLFGLLFYLIGLLPVVNLVDHIDYFGVILCEHYLYIAGIGIFLILAGTIIFLNKKHGIIAKVLGAGLFLFFCGLTLINNNYYKDPVVFYKHILSLDPGHSFVRVNLGNIYLQKNMFDQAIQEGRSTLIWEEDAWGMLIEARGSLTWRSSFIKK